MFVLTAWDVRIFTYFLLVKIFLKIFYQPTKKGRKGGSKQRYPVGKCWWLVILLLCHMYNACALCHATNAQHLMFSTIAASCNTPPTKYYICSNDLFLNLYIYCSQFPCNFLFIFWKIIPSVMLASFRNQFRMVGKKEQITP